MRTCEGRWFASPGDLTGCRCSKKGHLEESGGWFCAEHAPSRRRAKEERSRRPQWAMEACRALIEGGGTADDTQRAIDLARIALGKDPMPDTQPFAFKPVGS